MKKVTFAIDGLGNRGTVYASKQLEHPEEMEVVAIADPRRERLDAALKFLSVPEERVFNGFDEMIQQPKMADIMVIAVQDAMHRDHAIRAMEKGYDLLLEKPIANSAEDCIAVQRVAERLGRRVFVGHVLRYTEFYRNIKRLIDEGWAGRIMNIQAMENVGYYHIAHSYVRGNWHKKADSSCMILAKSCHDMDLMLWLTGKHCQKVTSFGSLELFKRENCPEGAPDRCIDGCKEDCPFNAVNFYLSRLPGWPTNILHPEPTKENILEALRTTNYGKCVYKMDNDVVDHQVVNMLLEDGITVAFTMTGFSAVQDREIRIMGTEGEIRGSFRDRVIYYQKFNKELHTLDLNSNVKLAGHGGGDSGIVNDVIKYYQGVDFDTSSITTVDRSVESHLVAFAAEKSRVNGGIPVDPKSLYEC